MTRKALIQQLRALAEPSRLSLIIRLSSREWGGAELLEAMKISQPSLSRHVRILREAGLIRERREGRNVYYQLKNNDLAEGVISLAQGLPMVGSQETEKKNLQINIDKSIDTTKPAKNEEDSDPKSGSIEEWLL